MEKFSLARYFSRRLKFHLMDLLGSETLTADRAEALTMVRDLLRTENDPNDQFDELVDEENKRREQKIVKDVTKILEKKEGDK